MAQHDYIIANQSGAAFRADLNNALAAIVSQNSGAAEPSVTYAYQPWADTTTGLFKIRNAANSAWITLYQLDGEWSTIALEDGTAAAPSLYFKDSGTDTGVYSPGTDQVAIATAGAQRVNFNGATEVVFNDGGNDVDFRIEGDTEPNLFKIDAGTDQVRVKNLNGGPLAGIRNLLINGNPIINQRGYVSGTATSGANEYTLDRWRVVTSGQSITWTDSANVRTVTAPAGGVEQVIEGLNILSGTYTLSWTGTATATVNGSPVTNGGQVTLTGGTNATVRFSGGTFSLAQFEVGTVATPFERRSYGQELALCQRYYQRLTAAGTGLRQSTESNGYLVTPFTYPVPMRAAPTCDSVLNGGAADGEGQSQFYPGQAGWSFGRISATCANFQAFLPGGVGTTANVPWRCQMPVLLSAEL
jgi:hypothetical protein